MARETATLALILASAALVVGGVACGNGDPGYSELSPLYRVNGPDRAAGEGGPTSGERGSVWITEIHYAGSIRNDGTHDWDDVFIEFVNKHERPVDPTGWRLIVGGDTSETYRIPETDPVQTNEYFVIASQSDGAFAHAADVVIDDLELGEKRVHITLLDHDKRLIEPVGSEDLPVFAGGWDTETVRSMERVQLIFNNSGSLSRSWHAYSDDEGFSREDAEQAEPNKESYENYVREDWHENTLASPGRANSADYSGSTSTADLN